MFLLHSRFVGGGKSEVIIHRVGTMDEKVEDCVSEWQRKLSLVLELIESHPDCIVDDTSVEKLLSWVRETAADEVQRNLLLHKNTTILVFLLNQPESLFSNALCGSFSLRLAGILAGCDEDVCKMLIDNGCLHNLALMHFRTSR